MFSKGLEYMRITNCSLQFSSNTSWFDLTDLTERFIHWRMLTRCNMERFVACFKLDFHWTRTVWLENHTLITHFEYCYNHLISRHSHADNSEWICGIRWWVWHWKSQCVVWWWQDMGWSIQVPKYWNPICCRWYDREWQMGMDDVFQHIDIVSKAESIC